VTGVCNCESVEWLLNCLYIAMQVTEKYWTLLTIKISELSDEILLLQNMIPTVKEVPLMFNNHSIIQNHPHGV
jgi:hypothetical protein